MELSQLIVLFGFFWVVQIPHTTHADIQAQIYGVFSSIQDMVSDMGKKDKDLVYTFRTSRLFGPFLGIAKWPIQMVVNETYNCYYTIRQCNFPNEDNEKVTR